MAFYRRLFAELGIIIAIKDNDFAFVVLALYWWIGIAARQCTPGAWLCTLYKNYYTYLVFLFYFIII